MSSARTSRLGDLTGRFQQYFSGRRGREFKEYLTGYGLIAPAILLIFLFGIFPVAFALYVSLHKWLILRDEFIGLGNYVAALDNLAYIGAFALGLGAVYGGLILLRRIGQRAQIEGQRPWLLAIPSGLLAAAILAFIRWVFYQLPEFLDIARKMRGLERTRDLFIRLLSEAFYAESVYPAFLVFVGLLSAAVLATLLSRVYLKVANKGAYQQPFTLAWLSIALGLGLLYTTFQSVNAAYTTAIETGADPGFWPQLVMIVSGVIFLYFGWRLWRTADQEDRTRYFFLRLLGASALMMAAVLLIIEIPSIVASGDPDLWDGLRVTIFFSLGTVPVQLTVALFLSVLLFQKMRGSELFRIIFFLPYVTPAIASATVFRLMFSERTVAPANMFFNILGLDAQAWLREPQGVFTLLAQGLGVSNFPQAIIPTWLPDDFELLLAGWLTGPSLALVVIILLSIWTFVGYNTVIYLAGLASIDAELTEAASIDGANRWQVFRHITFPLLSPTTYFLSLIAIMGTFKAFNTIWVMRLGQSLGTVDTFSIVIFDEFFTKGRYGYASALAFVLFAIILGLTFVNNRVQGRRVFYG
ncbi:MAG TPA: ABC transporter permease subunit [Anaerolineales bacterium]|nr:ABC transporter permease subunit [Anaerolineales bacterium]